VEVFHDGDTLEAQGSMGFCTCANETAVITAKGGEPGKRSVRLLRTDARDFGSVQGFSRGAAKPASVLDCACAEDQIDGWLSMPAAVETLHAPDVEWTKKDGAAIELASSGPHASVLHGTGRHVAPADRQRWWLRSRDRRQVRRHPRAPRQGRR
jgi:hypothetical protein